MIVYCGGCGKRIVKRRYSDGWVHFNKNRNIFCDGEGGSAHPRQPGELPRGRKPAQVWDFESLVKRGQ